MRKYVTILSIISLLLSLGGTVKEEAMALGTNEGAIILNRQVNKLSQGMTMAEIVQLIGEPTANVGSGRYIPMYLFADDEQLILDLGDNNKLVAARNKDGFDLLKKEYAAKIADFPIYVDNEQIITSNPIVTISDKTYIPIKELEEQLGIKVEWSEDEKAVKIITK